MRDLKSAQSVTELLRTAVRTLVEEHGAQRVLVMVGEQKAIYGLNSGDIWQSEELNLTVLRKVLTYGAVITSQDARITVNYLKLEDRANIFARSVLCVPLSRTGSQVAGLIYIDHPEPNAFDQSVRNSVVELASEIERRRPALPLESEASESESEFDSRSRYSQMLDARELMELSSPRAPVATDDLALSSEELFSLLFQLSKIMGANIELDHALSMIEDSGSQDRRELCCKLRTHLAEGNTLSEAFTAHPKTFDSVLVRLVESGEQTGTLVKVLDDYTHDLESGRALRMRLLSSLTYPLVMAFMGLFLSGILIYILLPPFLLLLSSFDAPIPWSTRFLISASQHPLFKYGIPLTLLCLANLLLVLHKLGKLKPVLARVVLKIPVLGQLCTQASWAQWCRSLASLVGSGIALVPALELLAGTSGFRALDREIYDVAEDLKDGLTIGEALQRCQTIPNIIPLSVTLAEESGTLELVLDHLGQLLQEDTEHKIHTSSQLVEPFLVCVVGVILGFVGIAAFQPVLHVVTRL